MTQTARPEGTGAPAYPVTRACPYQMPVGYEQLRERGPLTKVTLYDGRRVWLVTGNEVGRALFPDPRLSSDVLHPGFPFLAPRIAAQTQQRAASPLVGVDDPEHGRQRRMVIPGFGIRRVAALRPEIERIAEGLIDEMLDRGSPAELLSQYALPLPSPVICALLGVPFEDRAYFDERSRHVLSSSGQDEAEQARKAFTEILVYLFELIAKKEKEPADGLIDELIETLMPGAVEELMRFTSIGDVLMRVAAADIEFSGKPFRSQHQGAWRKSRLPRESRSPGSGPHAAWPGVPRTPRTRASLRLAIAPTGRCEAGRAPLARARPRAQATALVCRVSSCPRRRFENGRTQWGHGDS